MKKFKLYVRIARCDSYTVYEFKTQNEMIDEANYLSSEGWEVVINPKGNLDN